MITPMDILSSLDPDLYRCGSDVGERHAVDWSGEAPCLPEVVFRPTTTRQVAEILALCHRHDQPIVVQGGLTGLAGGATPQPGEWALSLERMNRIVELDEASMTITVEAGTTLQVIQDAATRAGLHLPLDLGARGSCMAGGLVSTNAGGNQVIQHGMTRALVLGLVAVLADGTVIPSRNKLLKNNAGFDLKQLFIGSEGTLGVVTEATLRLFPAKPYRQTALCALESFEAVIQLLRLAGQELEAVCSFEVMWADYFSRATGVTQNNPFGPRRHHPFTVLLETETANESTSMEALQSLLYGLMESGDIVDAVVAQSGKEADAMWAIRDAVAELLPTMAPLANFDIGIPLAGMNTFTEEVTAALRGAFPGCEVLIFGHVGDGNLHILATTGRTADTKPIYDLVYQAIGPYGGTITAEHGIGAMKRNWLARCRSASEIALMRTLKQALDPRQILNRGRVI